MNRWIVAYDISDDLDRQRVASRLCREGMRIQLSVFDVQTEDIQGLIDDISGMIDVNTDCVRALPQCTSCIGRSLEVGQSEAGLRTHWWVV